MIGRILEAAGFMPYIQLSDGNDAPSRLRLMAMSQPLVVHWPSSLQMILNIPAEPSDYPTMTVSKRLTLPRIAQLKRLLLSRDRRQRKRGMRLARWELTHG
jgi:hypothetical protein